MTHSSITEESTMSNQPFMQYEVNETSARWHGGAYIELGYIDEQGSFTAGDVINVWDYAKDEPRIPRTLAAFQARVDAFMIEQAEEEEMYS
jgi:hypothetical protein